MASPALGAFFLVSLGAALALHGAVPFVAVPTLGQAVWTTGFSQSFVNDSLLTIHAGNFGLPEPAAIAFGLAGAYPAGLLIASGLHPADAYAAMAALWFSVAFVGAYSLARKLGTPPALSVLAALLWLSMPVVWVHAGYSMVSMGFALLPFYFLAAYKLFFESIGTGRFSLAVPFYLFTCILAVFMDGYSFMMFATGSSTLAAYAFLTTPSLRKRYLVSTLPVHALGFGAAYLLYAIYIGKPGFSAAPLDFLRGWGADVTFFLIPTQGIHWIWDTLGLSVARSGRDFFGDSSVWKTTFCLPLLLTGVFAWWRVRGTQTMTAGFVIIALFGLYMALGPSLKINSTRPAEMIEAGDMTRGMRPELAVAPTGSAVLSGHLPGFENMRAAYRWIALAVLGLWALVVLLAAHWAHRRRWPLAVGVLFLLILSNLPHPASSWSSHLANRQMFKMIDHDLVVQLQHTLKPQERVAFLPYRNDFLVNYLAARLDVHTYNIGGDKNLWEARRHWPLLMRRFEMGKVDSKFSDRILVMLASGDLDAVVLPYIDMLWAAHSWPAPIEYEEDLEPVEADLERSSFVELQRMQYFSVARLERPSPDGSSRAALERRLYREACVVPLCIEANGFADATPRRVGRLQNGRLHASGETGFLLFGPYAPLEAGRYRLTVEGRVADPGSGFIDIVSNQGTRQHARFPLSRKLLSNKGILLEESVELAKPADDIEVRVFTDGEGELEVHGCKMYKLGP